MIIVSFTSQSVDLPDPRSTNAPMKPREVCFSSHLAASAVKHSVSPRCLPFPRSWHLSIERRQSREIRSRADILVSILDALVSNGLLWHISVETGERQCILYPTKIVLNFKNAVAIPHGVSKYRVEEILFF